jgi:two-component system KDP operon response regulator KdpE
VAKSILVVDDDPVQVKMFAQLLSFSGYKILKAASGHEAVNIVNKEKPDLVLLDVMMPGIDGWQTCRLIRDFDEIPIIMLTGKHNTEADIVRGLECGADEYLSKPIGNRELVARVKAVLRRADSPLIKKIANVHFSDDILTIDVAEHRVMVSGKKVRLTPHEFRLLALLLENAGCVVSHHSVLEHVWGFEYIDDIDYVRIYISHLRQKIEPDPSVPRYILTEAGVGYYFQNIS